MTKQDKEQDENEISDVLEIEKTITNLQGLGMCLKEVVLRLPVSRAKEYLLAEVSKAIKFKEAHDFCYLHCKMSWMINMVERYGLEGEILELLKEIRVETKRIINYVEKE